MVEAIVELAAEAVIDTVQEAVQDVIQDVAEEAGESALDAIKHAASSLANGIFEFIDGSDLVPDLGSSSSSKVYKVKANERTPKEAKAKPEKKPYKSRDKRHERAVKRKLAKQRKASLVL